MRLVWKWAYIAVAHLLAMQIRRHEPRCAVYLRGSLTQRELVAGLSDVDLIAVVPSEPGRPGAARERIRTQMDRAARRFPVLGAVLLDWPTVYEANALDLTTGISTFTYGLGHPLSSQATVYWGPDADIDVQRWLERPELYGRRTAWRLIAGPEGRPPDRRPGAEERCLTAWLELQNWWRWAFRLCADPGRPSSSYLAVKLLAEAVRIWVWLTRGESIPRRADALALGSRELPEEAEGFERARRLYAQLHRSPDPPLERLLPPFVRLSARIAGVVESLAAGAGTDEVELLDWAGDDLLLVDGGRDPSSWEPLRGDVPPLLPLVDWRTLVSPIEPDETFALIDGDPSDPAVVGHLAMTFESGPYPTLTGHGLMFRPSHLWHRSRLRSVQCRVTDPVSFALAERSPKAHFPRLPGWSIGDTTQRAVAEHGAWLDLPKRPGSDESNATIVGRLLTAARAALVWESRHGGTAQIPLSADAVLDLLASQTPSLGSLTEEVRAAYHEFAAQWVMPDDALVRRLHSAVIDLPAYTQRDRTYEAT